MTRREAWSLTGAGLVAVAVCLLATRIGPIAWPDVIGPVLELRLARIAIGASVGVCLAVGGVVLQALLRNPLASPDLIGVSSGAGLAVVIAAALVGGGWAGGWFAGPALIGAAAALGVVYLVSRRRGTLDPVMLILVGVMVSVICSSATMLVQSLLPFGASGGGGGGGGEGGCG